MSLFHHRKLPEMGSDLDRFKYPNVLCGHSPPSDLGTRSDQLQILYNYQDWSWVGPDGEPLHYHTESDECFVVLQGGLTIQVANTRHEIGSREFCFFPKGVIHAILAVHTPVEFLVIRAPSVNDKVYVDA